MSSNTTGKLSDISVHIKPVNSLSTEESSVWKLKGYFWFAWLIC